MRESGARLGERTGVFVFRPLPTSHHLTFADRPTIAGRVVVVILASAWVRVRRRGGGWGRERRKGTKA